VVKVEFPMMQEPY